MKQKTLIDAAKHVLGHSRFYARGGVVHLDETDQAVSATLQAEIEAKLTELNTPTLEEIKAEAVKAVKQRHAETLNALTGGETIEERDTWAPKAKAAERYLSVSPETIKRNEDGTAKDAEFLMIETEALFGEDDPILFAETIKGKAEEYARLIGLAGGIKRKALTAIHAAQSAEEVEAALLASDVEAEAELGKWLAKAA